MKKLWLAVAALVLLGGIIFWIVGRGAEGPSAILKRQASSLEELSKTMDELERGLPGIINASRKSLAYVRSMREKLARAQSVIDPGQLKGVLEGYQKTELALEAVVKLMESCTLALGSERTALNVLLENHRQLSLCATNGDRGRREAGGEYPKGIEANHQRIEGLLKMADSTLEFIGPLLEKEQTQLVHEHDVLKNLLVLAQADPDLKASITLLLAQVELTGVSVDHARKVHSFGVNCANKLRLEQGVQKALASMLP